MYDLTPILAALALIGFCLLGLALLTGALCLHYWRGKERNNEPLDKL